MSPGGDASLAHYFCHSILGRSIATALDAGLSSYRAFPEAACCLLRRLLSLPAPECLCCRFARDALEGLALSRHRTTSPISVHVLGWLFGARAPQAVAGEVDAVGVVYDAIEDGVGVSRISD
jgi:hypothetical protein